MADIITSVSNADSMPYDPKYLDKVLRANERNLADIVKSSHRKWETHMRSTAELREKYKVR